MDGKESQMIVASRMDNKNIFLCPGKYPRKLRSAELLNKIVCQDISRAVKAPVDLARRP